MEKRIKLPQVRDLSKYLVLPPSAVLLIASVIPLLMLVLFSFVKGNVTTTQGIQGYTTANLASVFCSGMVRTLMLKSLAFALIVTVITCVIAYPAAWAIAKIVSERHRNMLIMIAIIPAFTSQLLLIHAIMLLLQANGVVMNALSAIGLADPNMSILYTNACVILILVYEYLPYMILCLYSCLEKIDMNVIEAAHSLGAGRFKTFVSVVLPQSFSGIMTGVLIVFIPCAGSFVEPKVAGGPYGMMIGSLIDSQFTTLLNMGYGAALSLGFLMVMAIVLAIINQCIKRSEKVIGG